MRISGGTRRWATLGRSVALAVVGAMVGAGLVVAAPAAQAAAPPMSADQHRAYLHHYAPLLLKRGDEDYGRGGRDWLTNVDFDADGDFSTNRANWRRIGEYRLAAGNPDSPYRAWRLRPTLYTAIVEHAEADGSKTVILLYHVYNAADKDEKEIHDWERVEIVVRGVTGTPGGPGERFEHATITHHKDHVLRRADEVQFMDTATGRHLMLWQADISDVDLPSAGPHGHELRFVTTPFAALPVESTTDNARVDISASDDRQRVHYAFVPGGSADAVRTWRARPLLYATAFDQASAVDDDTSARWQAVKRMTYELQDLADITTTHWAGGDWSRHWRADAGVRVLLDSPITDETGQPVVPAGLQQFWTRSRDAASGEGTDGRNGQLSKAWFYGGYSAEASEDTPSGSDDFGGYEGDGRGSDGFNRADASGDDAALGQYWRQHDFFVHTGGLDDSSSREVGRWLPAGWASAAAGGFDGRWAQLFDDRAGQEEVAPLRVTISSQQTANCEDTFILSALATGGVTPYTFAWSNGFGQTGTQSGQLVPDGYYEVQVTSADGQVAGEYLRTDPICR